MSVILCDLQRAFVLYRRGEEHTIRSVKYLDTDCQENCSNFFKKVLQDLFLNEIDTKLTPSTLRKGWNIRPLHMVVGKVENLVKVFCSDERGFRKITTRHIVSPK